MRSCFRPRNPGNSRSNIEARPEPALSVHQVARWPPFEFAGGMAIAEPYSGCCSREILEADNVVDGAATATVNGALAGTAPVMVMVRGFGVQLTPGGSPVPAQVTCTLPVKPPLGVMVMVDTPVLPAVTVTGVAAMLNEPEEVTLMEIAPDGPDAK